jgi:hypothetical protein
MVLVVNRWFWWSIDGSGGQRVGSGGQLMVLVVD